MDPLERARTSLPAACQAVAAARDEREPLTAEQGAHAAHCPICHGDAQDRADIPESLARKGSRDPAGSPGKRPPPRGPTLAVALHMPGRAVVVALVSLGTLLLAPSTRTEEPVLTVRGLGTWDEALAALRADLKG